MKPRNSMFCHITITYDGVCKQKGTFKNYVVSEKIFLDIHSKNRGCHNFGSNPTEYLILNQKNPILRISDRQAHFILL
jgi:hypothetical protein